MKILVVGGEGYIGKAITKELEKSNYSYTNLSRNPKSPNSIKCSLLDKNLKEKVKSFDLIINLASIIRSSKKSKYKENILGLKNLLNSMNKNQKLIYFSTINVLIKNSGYYGTSKKECENLIKNSQIKTLILRPNYVYGIDKENDIHRLIQIVKKTKLCPIIGTGNNKIQPINKEDLAKITVSLIKNFREETINLSGRDEISFNEIINVSKLKHLKIKIPLFLIKPFKKLIPFDLESFEGNRTSKVNFKLKHNISEDIQKLK